MNLQQRNELFARFAKQNPHPKTELLYKTPFELLIAVMLSAQATDKSVNLATKKLFTIANTPKAMLELGEQRLKEYIRTIGLYNTKAANIIKTCKILMDEYPNALPNQLSSLQKLPGVGRKTANVILNTLFAKPTIPVDTHVFRVANRTGLAKASTPLQVEKLLLKQVPAPYLTRAHHWLVLHGRYVCLARKPKCPTCLIRDLCAYKEKTLEK